MKEIGTEVFWSTVEVRDIFSLPDSRFRQWLRWGYVHTDIRAKGSGSSHYFRYNNVLAIGIITRLVNLGYKRQRSSYVAYSITNNEWEKIKKADTYFLIVGANDLRKHDRRWKSKLSIHKVERLDRFDLSKIRWDLIIILDLKKIVDAVEKEVKT